MTRVRIMVCKCAIETSARLVVATYKPLLFRTRVRTPGITPAEGLLGGVRWRAMRLCYGSSRAPAGGVISGWKTV